MDGNEGNTIPAPAARRGRRPRSGVAAATPSAGRRKAPENRAEFDASVRKFLAERLGGEGVAEAVLAGNHFGQTLTAYHAMRGSVSSSDERCANTIVDVLASERALELKTASDADLEKRGGDPHQVTIDEVLSPPVRTAAPSRPTDDEATQAVAGR
jgi:hypothetical protein